jgi:hypothetical protein
MPNQETHCHDGADDKGRNHYGVHRAKDGRFFAIHGIQPGPDEFGFALIGLGDGFLHGLLTAYSGPTVAKSLGDGANQERGCRRIQRRGCWKRGNRAAQHGLFTSMISLKKTPRKHYL